MRWRIYYGDGGVYGDRDGPPWMAPQTDVQIVAQEDLSNPRGFILMKGKAGYFWREDIGWNGCDEAGLWDYLLTYRGPKVVLFGRTVGAAEYDRAAQRAATEGLG